jgi:hypothetical protein
MLHDFTVSYAVPSKNNKTLSKSAEIAPSFLLTNCWIIYIQKNENPSLIKQKEIN